MEGLVAAQLASLGFSQGPGLKVRSLWTVRPANVGAFVPDGGQAGAPPKMWLQRGTRPGRWQHAPRFTYSLMVTFTDAATGQERYRVTASQVARADKAAEVAPLLVKAALASAPLPASPPSGKPG